MYHKFFRRKHWRPVFLVGSWLAIAIGLAAQTPGRVEEPAKLARQAADQTAKPGPLRQILRDGRYVLQPGDEIAIKVFRVSELDDNLKIGPDGRISVQLLNDVEAAGLTVEELRAKLIARYSEFYREPEVSVIVRTFVNLKVFVGGEVERPGLLPLDGEMTVLAAVLSAGGFRSSAKTNSVILIRNGEERPLVAKLNLKDVYQKGKQDVVLQPFDVVYVPMSKIARIDRFVDQYLRQTLPIPLTGGFTYLFGQSTSSVIRFN